VAVGLELEIPLQGIKEALSQFTGVQRRFQIKASIHDILVVDDYGHHPSEIRATLRAAKAGWGRRLLVIFQPHRYTRTLHLWEEFLTAFHEADSVILVDVYAAGEEPISGVGAAQLCREIRERGHRDASYSPDRDQTVEQLKRRLLPGDMVITLGAGDVWKLGEELIGRLQREDWPHHEEGR